jgi:mono/diheme cytochrome c family protein
MKVWLTMIALLVTLATTATVRSQQRDAGDPHEWMPPKEQAARANPLETRPDLAAGGRKLFQQRCAQCHGDDGSGTSRAPDLTRRTVQSQSDGALYWRISSGNAYTGMPTFSYLPELQRWQIVLHLRTLTTTAATPSRSVTALR